MSLFYFSELFYVCNQPPSDKNKVNQIVFYVAVKVVFGNSIQFI